MAIYDIAKGILKRAYPSADLRSQSVDDWKGDFDLPIAVIRYYVEFGPVDLWIRGYGNPYFLPSLANLWEYQVGYRTDRVTHERVSGWADDWLVIADEGADPFIFSRSDETILMAYHGEGIWQPAKIFENLSDMITTFAILGDIVKTAGNGLTDEDSIILLRYRVEAQRRIGEFLESRTEAERIVTKLGWDPNTS